MGERIAKGGAFPRLVESTPRYGVSLRPPLWGPWPSGVTWMAWQSYCKFQLLWQINFYLQGLTLVSRCSQLTNIWLPAAGTPLGQGRPGHGNCPAIGPAARIAWCGGRTRRHSKGDGPNLGLTQFQPRTPREVLRGERPKWLFVHFGQSKWTPAERVSPRQGKSYA